MELSLVSKRGVPEKVDISIQSGAESAGSIVRVNVVQNTGCGVPKNGQYDDVVVQSNTDMTCRLALSSPWTATTAEDIEFNFVSKNGVPEDVNISIRACAANTRRVITVDITQHTGSGYLVMGPNQQEHERHAVELSNNSDMACRLALKPRDASPADRAKRRRVDRL